MERDQGDGKPDGGGGKKRNMKREKEKMCRWGNGSADCIFSHVSIGGREKSGFLEAK